MWGLSMKKSTGQTIGSPSSKYKHRRTSTWLHNTRNIRICMEQKKKKKKKPIVSVTYENQRISIKKKIKKKIKQLTLHKMCVTSLLCGLWADLWPFYWLYCKRFSLQIKVYQGWGLHRSGPREPPRGNGRKFAPKAPVASKFPIGNTRQFSFPFVILLQEAFAPRVNQRSQISATFPV